MTDISEPVISLATTSDLCAVLALQKLAFRTEAEIYHDFSIPPLTQTLESMTAEFSTKTFLKACLADVVVGSVRGFQKDSTCHVERLVVHPHCQGRGIGTALMRALEARFSDVQRYELFTGHKSERNLRLYRSSVTPCSSNRACSSLWKNTDYSYRGAEGVPRSQRRTPPAATLLPWMLDEPSEMA